MKQLPMISILQLDQSELSTVLQALLDLSLKGTGSGLDLRAHELLARIEAKLPSNIDGE